MALNVQTSLANALFTQERAASSKARADEKASATTKAKSSVFDSATTPGVTPQRFDDMVSGKKAASSRSQKAADAPRARAPMPGQILGHQDTVVSARDGGKSAESDAAKVSKDKTESDAARVSEEVAPENPDTVEAATAEAEGESVAAEAADDEFSLSDEQSQQDASQHNSDGQPRQDASQQDSEGVATPETAQGDTAADQVSTPCPGLMGADVTLTPGAVPAAPPVGATATPPGGLEGMTGEQDVRVVETIAPVMNSTGNANVALIAAETSAAEGASDLDLLPGMAKPVETGAERFAEAVADGKSAPEGKTGKATGDVGPDAKINTAASFQPAEGPTLRGSIFTQTLSDFAGLHGFERGQDLLSALDRPVAAAAQANRAADVQRPTPLQMLPIEIGMQAVRGAREFQIRLDPSELGRVDVKLHINEKGEVNASMVVERPETLQLLRRDATTLAQAFEQAGLKQGENSLSFSLKGENQQGQQQNNGRNASVKDGEDAALNAQIGEIAMRRVMIPNSSLDLMV